MITDTNGNPMGSATEGGSPFRFAQAKSTAVTIPMLVDCKDGYKLFCDATISQTAIEGRFTGDVSWTNLESSYLDLSPFDGIRKAIEIRSTTGNVSRVKVTVPLRVEKI